MQDYNFDLAPTMPEFNAQPGGMPPLAQWGQAQQDFRNTPEYLEWQQRQEARGPLSESTTQAIGLQDFDAAPDINPYISMGMGGGQDPTYENYLSNIERLKTERENYVPQSTTTSLNPGSAGIGAGLDAYRRLGFTGGPNQADAQYRQQLQLQPALGGPIQQQIQQGLGSLSQGAGI